MQALACLLLSAHSELNFCQLHDDSFSTGFCFVQLLFLRRLSVVCNIISSSSSICEVLRRKPCSVNYGPGFHVILYSRALCVLTVFKPRSSSILFVHYFYHLSRFCSISTIARCYYFLSSHNTSHASFQLN